MSVPPVEPLQPDVADTSGNATPVTDVVASDAVACSVNEPVPAGRKYCVFVPES